jgi:excisionase family DNA binding protein
MVPRFTEPVESFVTVGELARLLAVSETTVARMVADGMPCRRFGRRVLRFQPSKALAWAEAQDRKEAA